jgi:hypothetical protein
MIIILLMHIMLSNSGCRGLLKIYVRKTMMQPITQEHMNGTYSCNYNMARQSHYW